jgi:hypothetical protein
MMADTVSIEAYRELARACSKRAEERDDASGAHLVDQALDYERRVEVARMLGMSFGCETPQWDILLVRLNECLTTFRANASRTQQ